MINKNTYIFEGEDGANSTNYVCRVRTGMGGFVDATNTPFDILVEDVLIKVPDEGPWFALFRDIPTEASSEGASETGSATSASGSEAGSSSSEADSSSSDSGTSSDSQESSGGTENGSISQQEADSIPGSDATTPATDGVNEAGNAGDQTTPPTGTETVA